MNDDDTPIMDTGALAPLFDTEPEQFEELDNNG